jgi:hypothetical protein
MPDHMKCTHKRASARSAAQGRVNAARAQVLHRDVLMSRAQVLHRDVRMARARRMRAERHAQERHARSGPLPLGEGELRR